MDDKEALGRINELVDEEHEPYHRAEKGGLSVQERERMRQLSVNLEQYCNLLRQRRALGEAGYNPGRGLFQERGYRGRLPAVILAQTSTGLRRTS